VVDQELVDHPIKIIGRHARADSFAGRIHGLAGDPARDAHFLDRLGRLDIASGVTVRCWPAHVPGPRDAGRHLACRRDGRGLDGHFPILRGRPERVVSMGVTSKLGAAKEG